jgi:hypothetical protein
MYSFSPSFLPNFFFSGIGFELRTPYLQSRHCATQATPPFCFAVVILETGSMNYLLRLASNCDPPDLSLPGS